MQRIRTTTGQLRRRTPLRAPPVDSGAAPKKSQRSEPDDRPDASRQAAIDLRRGDQKAPTLDLDANNGGTVGAGLPSTMPLGAQQAFDAMGRESQGAALLALEQAGIGPPTIDVGRHRRAGIGITVPLMSPTPSIDLQAYLAAPPLTDLSTLRIAVSADHGALGSAERVAAALRALGVGDVVIIAPRQGERMNYGVSTHATLELLEQGKVDRVVSFCGNGLGALDVANLHAFAKPPRVKPPVYGDNLWAVVEGKARGADVLALGARLIGDSQTLSVFLKAFLDVPPVASSTAPPVHGITSKLIDPKPERIAGRTLSAPIDDLVTLNREERARIGAQPVTVYFNPNDRSVPAQMKALRQWLPTTVRFRAWDGGELPPVKDGERAILLSQPGSTAVSTHPWGSFTPNDEPNAAHRVHRAEHVKSVTAFVRDTTGPGGLTLDLPASALTDAACGGANHDLLKLLVKSFLLAQQGEATAHKALYGEALQFGTAMLEHGAPPPELASWGEALDQARAGARRV